MHLPPNPDFDEAPDRRGSGSLKWDRYAGRDVIAMWVADMDFRAPPPVLDALQAKLRHGVLGYGHAPASLSDALHGWMHRNFKWAPPADSTIWLAGVNHGLTLACRAFAEPGDEVLVPVPIYPPFLHAPASAGCVARLVPLARRSQTSWELDLDALDAACSPRTRLLFLCHPHNPVGRVWNRGELENLAGWALRRGLLVVSDEIHAGLTLDGRAHIPWASLSPDVAAASITLTAASKAFNIPGIPVAAATVPDTARRNRLLAAARAQFVDTSPLAHAAAEAAFRLADPWRLALLRVLESNRDHLARTLAADFPTLPLAPIEATALAWLDVSSLGWRNAGAHCEAHGLGISDGRDFRGPGFIRINLGCPRSTLDLGLQRLASALRAPEATAR